MKSDLLKVDILASLSIQTKKSAVYKQETNIVSLLHKQIRFKHKDDMISEGQ